ncbi:MAG: glycosyltransferase family 2 protein [Desulfobacterales bacterium]|jgi:glycosyltransferase involved in cell wall biosynthesis|nr:glycosyltransferase family 2 protein [Desulfobacterales bacterium]
MNSQICISAIIPTYNRAVTLKRAIDSIIAQTQPVSELIIIDDGSEDRTKDIVEAYGGRIKYFYQKNQGVSFARNRGVAEAQYDWIAFLDSDDYWHVDYIRRIVNAIEATHAKADLYFCDSQRSKRLKNRLHWDIANFAVKDSYELKADGSDWALMPIQPMIMPSSVIRKKTFLEVGGLPAHLITREDTFLFYKIALLYPVCAVQGCGAIVTSDASNRLTENYSSLNSLVYWKNSVYLYESILHSTGNLKKDQRKLLIGAISDAYYSIGRLFLLKREYAASAKHFFLSLTHCPASFSKRFLNSTRKLMDFPACCVRR